MPDRSTPVSAFVYQTAGWSNWRTTGAPGGRTDGVIPPTHAMCDPDGVSAWVWARVGELVGISAVASARIEATFSADVVLMRMVHLMYLSRVFEPVPFALGDGAAIDLDGIIANDAVSSMQREDVVRHGGDDSVASNGDMHRRRWRCRQRLVVNQANIRASAQCSAEPNPEIRHGQGMQEISLLAVRSDDMDRGGVATFQQQTRPARSRRTPSAYCRRAAALFGTPKLVKRLNPRETLREG